MVGAIVVSATLRTTSWQPGASRLLADPSLDEYRGRLWRAALLMWREAPIFGIGEGAFCWRYRAFVAAGSALDVPFPGDAHNTWLQVLSTRGILGLAALAGLAVAAGVAVRRVLTGAVPGVPRGLGIACAAALSGALVYSGPQSLFYIQGLQVLFWGTVALASLGERDPSTGPPWPAWFRTAAWPGLALLLVASASHARPEWTGLEARLARQPRGFYGARPDDDSVRRWSSSRGVLCLYPGGPVVRLTVSPGQRPPHLLPVEVVFRVGDRLVDRVVFDKPERVERSLSVPEGSGLPPPSPPLPFGECSPDARALRLAVEVSSVWTRMMASGYEDYRHRGVAIGPGKSPQ